MKFMEQINIGKSLVVKFNNGMSASEANASCSYWVGAAAEAARTLPNDCQEEAMALVRKLSHIMRSVIDTRCW